jgi:predicted dehydrogenase
VRGGQPLRPVTCDGPDGYVGELRHFLDAVRQGRAPEVVTPEDGLNSVLLCEAEEKSVLTRQIVRL